MTNESTKTEYTFELPKGYLDDRRCIPRVEPEQGAGLSVVSEIRAVIPNAAPEGWPRPRDAGRHRADWYSIIARHPARVDERPRNSNDVRDLLPVGEVQEEVFPSQ